MTVEWTEAATAHVVAIRAYLGSVSSPYAQLVVDRIVEKTERLERQPYLGAEVSEYKDESLRELFEHPYRILYRVRDDRVRSSPSSTPPGGCPSTRRGNPETGFT